MNFLQGYENRVGRVVAQHVTEDYSRARIRVAPNRERRIDVLDLDGGA